MATVGLGIACGSGNEHSIFEDRKEEKIALKFKPDVCPLESVQRQEEKA